MAVDARLELLSPLGELAGLAYIVPQARVELASPLGDVSGLAFLETYGWAELPSPLGDLAGLVHVVRQTRVELSSPLGDLKLRADPIWPRVRAALASPLGTLEIFARRIPGGVITLPSPLGVLRVVAQSLGDSWTAAGFPLPKIQGYTYQRDAGLVRTKMLAGNTLQRRKWTNAYRQATVSFEIPTSLLYEMEAFIDEQGYTMFNMSLVTGDNVAETAEIHSVRIIADPAYGDVYGENITVTLTIEIGNKLAGPAEPEEPEEPLCPLPYPSTWIALASATGAAPNITQLNGTVALLEDGTFSTGGSSSTIGEALYSGLCNELQRADGEPLRFRLRFISASSGNEFTLQVRLIWRDSAGTQIASNQFDAGEEYTFSGATPWNTLDTMELEIGHFYGAAQLNWAFEIWSGGLDVIPAP